MFFNLNGKYQFSLYNRGKEKFLDFLTFFKIGENREKRQNSAVFWRKKRENFRFFSIFSDMPEKTAFFSAKEIFKLLIYNKNFAFFSFFLDFLFPSK